MSIMFTVPGVDFLQRNDRAAARSRNIDRPERKYLLCGSTILFNFYDVVLKFNLLSPCRCMPTLFGVVQFREALHMRKPLLGR